MTDTPRTLTGPEAAAAGRATLEQAGVDVDELERRRDEILGATLPVITAARDVIDNLGTRGATARAALLRGALQNLVEKDPTSAIVITAALWSDRYGSAGAPRYLVDMQEAVDALR